MAVSGARHPEHDALELVLRGWFTTSEPAIGYVVTEHSYGFLSDPGVVAGTRLILTVDRPHDVAAALADVRHRTYGPITIWIDERARCARLDRAMRDEGCKPQKSVTHLALVGERIACPGPASLTVEDVGPDGLTEWAETKLRCFGNSEEPPTDHRIARETAVRGPEMALARLQLARIDGEAVAVFAYYTGRDQLVFNLGTRVPFRHRGIAQQLLSRWIAAGRAEGCRSLMINADHLGEPEALYRRMGFADEIYWYQEYEYDAGAGDGTTPCPSPCR